MQKHVRKLSLTMPQSAWPPLSSVPVPFIEVPCDKLRYRFYISGRIIKISKSGDRVDVVLDEVPQELHKIPKALSKHLRQFIQRPPTVPRDKRDHAIR